MSSKIFIIGAKYTRKDIFRLLDISPEPTGGNWFTGYTSFHDEYYVFVNIDTAGRTGHFYGDHWLEDGSLHWYGKTGSHFAQRSIQNMLNPDTKVHFFTRTDNSEVEFTYRGTGHAEVLYLKTPVEVNWRFTT